MRRKISALLSVLLVLTVLFPSLPARAEETPDKLIAITFDDGPWRFTEELLDGLAERGAKATFFMVGQYVELRPATVKRAFEEGHQIASHTWDHPYLARLSDSTVREQLASTDAALDAAIGYDLDYVLRPPYGSYSDRAAAAANVPAIFWSMNTSDYTTSDDNMVYHQIIRSARDGGVCCLHDTHASTVRGALRAISELQSQGYQCVTVAELFYRRGIALEPGGKYYSAYPGETAPALRAPEFHLTEAPEGGWLVTMEGDARTAVYYTLDGSAPLPGNAAAYTEPFLIQEPCLLTAVGVADWNGLRTASVPLRITEIPLPRYLYNAADPGADFHTDPALLAEVSGGSAAAMAVGTQISLMRAAERSSPAGRDKLAFFAQRAQSLAAAEPLPEPEEAAEALVLLGNKAAWSEKSVSDVLALWGVVPARAVGAEGVLTSPETGELRFTVPADAASQGLSRLRIETPYAALTLSAEGLAAAAGETLALAPREGGGVTVSLPGVPAGAAALSLPAPEGAVLRSAEGAAVSSRRDALNGWLTGAIPGSGSYAPAEAIAGYADLPEDNPEMRRAIELLSTAGVLNGAAGRFEPERALTRAEFAAMLTRALGVYDPGAAADFSDVSAADWYAAAAGSAQRAGLLSGYSDGSFRGEAPIGRTEFAAALGKALRLRLGYAPDAGGVPELADAAEIPSWAVSDIALALREGLVLQRGDGRFAPEEAVERGDAAIMICRLFQRAW